ncbi:RHS repeat-associated core domain-containing protein, partial [Streptomyces sp. NPDC057910]|uniref:RHS repeat-associated core domain-containing protein n=1 Tax=Streptomyces sp. NPDC057910 TaxID=3346278 RepID=UPI0036ECAE6F
TTATDITGATTHYTYNKDGTLKQAVQKTPDGTTLAEVAYTYDGLGRITKVERGNKSITVYGYNDAGQITSDKTTRDDGSVITEAAYAYDSHGNLTSRTDTRPETSQDTPAASRGEGAGGKNSGGGVGAEAGGAGGLGRDDKGAVKNATTSTAYRYDAYNRLTHSTLTDADGRPLVETAYALNTSGDVTRTETTRHEGGQAKKTVTEHGIDAGGRLTTVTVDGDTKAQTWDAAGNLLTDHNGTVWTYNTSNQPLTATSPDGTTTVYTYWADGTRRDTVTTAKDGTTSRTGFHYTPDGTITNDTHTTSEGGGSGGGGTVTASYLSAATREARTLTGGTDSKSSGTAAGAGYLLHDRHGSTTALATTDQNAAVTAAWNYDDYGQHTTTNGTPLTTNGAVGEGGEAVTAGYTAAVNPFTYSGEHTDTRLGTQYLKNRIYDTGQGRFTTRDTAPLHNRYQYADANPVTNTDPTGRTAVLDRVVSGVMIGVTILAAIIGVALTWTGGGVALGIALAGAVLDSASAAVETAALATGNNQWDSPLNITAYTLGAAGLILGAASPAVSAGSKGLTNGIGKAVFRLPVKNKMTTWMEDHMELRSIEYMATAEERLLKLGIEIKGGCAITFACLVDWKMKRGLSQLRDFKKDSNSILEGLKDAYDLRSRDGYKKWSGEAAEGIAAAVGGKISGKINSIEEVKEIITPGEQYIFGLVFDYDHPLNPFPGPVRHVVTVAPDLRIFDSNRAIWSFDTLLDNYPKARNYEIIRVDL